MSFLECTISHLGLLLILLLGLDKIGWTTRLEFALAYPFLILLVIVFIHHCKNVIVTS